MQSEEILRNYFGYEGFREGQREIVDSILSGRDTLGVMPTGAGKSLCFQIPALMLPGITIVVSPLISLMQDQVGALVQSGIRAAYINSSLTPAQTGLAIRNARAGMYKLIYVAPERLDTDMFLSFAKEADISMITVDEAHCISQWGQDFRPSYLGITAFAAALPRRPIISAFTATATQMVREDIIDRLEMNDPYWLVTGFDRKNLYFEVRRPSDKYADLKRLVREYDKEGRNGIVYCVSRKNVETVCERLNADGFSATRYHAGLTEEERRANQEDFLYDRKRIMVATNAFGMGIDKSNVTYVIHYNMPKDVESYYQEAGRAGRDGSPSDCVLLYGGNDIRTAKFLIDKKLEESELPPDEAEEIRKKDMKKLWDMNAYCTGGDCLRGYILRYFGEKAPAECGCCSVCCSDTEETDITVDAQKILSCIYRAGQRYGATTICGILTGVNSDKLSRGGLDKLTTFGIMRDSSQKRIMRIIDRLESKGYILRTEGDYPVLKLEKAAYGVLKGQVTVKARIPEDSEKRQKKTELIYAADPVLLDILKKLRSKLAAVQGVPAYVIFTDTSLRDMCEKLPRSRDEFLEISGVGRAKLDRYGDDFINAIKAHCGDGGEPPSVVKEKKNRMRNRADAAEGFRRIRCGITDEMVSDEAVTITAFADRIIDMSGANVTCASFRRAMTDWLEEQGYIVTLYDSEGHAYKSETDTSESVGISAVEATEASGKRYKRVLYSPQAQRLILDSMEEISRLAIEKLD